MTEFHSNMKKKSYTHLTDMERGQIAAYHQEGLPSSEIGKRMGLNKSTISREIKRGTVEQLDTFRRTYTKYFPDVATRKYEENRLNCGARSSLIEAWDFMDFAEKKIKKENWSPDAVIGHAKRYQLFDYIPSTKTVYNWIDEGIIGIINLDLPLKLSRSTKKRKARKHKKVLGMSIEERPESVDTREQFGHWEIDTVLGHKSNDNALLTLVERKTRHKIAKRIDSKSAPAMTKALSEMFKNHPNVQKTFKTITSDNGLEFSELSDLGKTFGIDVYFAHPYASWERGSNEHHNGLIRRFIKKGQPIHSYSYEQIEKVIAWMNTLPRKILGYLTPNEADKPLYSGFTKSVALIIAI